LQDIHGELITVANHLHDAREAILMDWQRAIKRDPALNQGDSLPRAELFDHIPALLAAFVRGLRAAAALTVPAAAPTNSATAAAAPTNSATAAAALTVPAAAAAAPTERAADAAHEPAAAHGLQRWQQGYDLREVTRELGQLNKCVILELDRCAKQSPGISLDAMSRAREVWTTLCNTAVEESVTQYFTLQQREAEGHALDLERALGEIRELEQQRADQWRQAAHDLRGNLGVVANAAVGLTRHGDRDASRQEFVRILMRNVTSLHHLLEDVTSLARLQAGREKRQIEPLDATAILEPLCDGIRSLAEQRGLYLRCHGPSGFAVDGDAVKLRRIAQNLILNGVKYTRSGGVTVTWGDSAADDPNRWALAIQDTGPGFPTDSALPLAAALDPAGNSPPSSAVPSASGGGATAFANPSVGHADGAPASRGEAGEGIGLSIVKRLCEMLDAEIAMQSEKDVGTTFRILFPRRYAS
jgi:signal transduction histidine kinase